MTTISSSPSLSPKPFNSASSSRSTWGAASSRPGGGTSPFARPRHSPTIPAKTRDVPHSTKNSVSSASVVSAGTGLPRSSPRITEARVESGTIRSRPLRAPSPINSTRDFGTQYSPTGLPPTAPAHQGTLRSDEISSSSVSVNQQSTVKSSDQDESRDVLMSDHTSAPDSSSEQSRTQTSAASSKEPARSLTTSTPALHSSDISAQVAASRSMRAPKRPDSNASDSTSGSSALSLVNSLPSPSKKSRMNAPNMKVMPRNYMECDIRELGIIIADMLGELIRLNDKLSPRDGYLTRFHSRAPPTISVRDYLHRLIVHATLSPPLLLALVYYIDRLCALYPAFTITSLTVHRFLITAATVAAKGLSDSFWTNHTYARVGGVSTKELAMLELDFLSRLDWAIVPKPEVLEDYYRSLIARTEGYVLEDGSSSDES